jgi:poly(hydroxyalkanoate) granule-associated protein
MLGATELQEKVVGSVRHVWLAGLGAALLAQEEGGRFLDSLVEKGEAFEKQEGSPVAKMKETLKEATDKATSTWDAVAKRIDGEVAASLRRMGVPTRDEIATLTRRVDALIASVDKLRAKTTPGSAETSDAGIKG